MRATSVRSFIAILLLLQGLTAATAQAAPVTVSGTVIDEQSETPIAGAKVELVNANAGTGYFVTETDGDGRFTFTDVRANLVYDLAVLADGYVAYEMQSWQIPQNQREIDLYLPLIRGASIAGQVVRSDGETPIQNVEVQLRYVQGGFSMINQELSLFTDREGRFAFNHLPPNVYRLQFSRSGYIGEQLAAVRPQPGEEKTYTIELFEPATITGHVTLADDGSPLSDMEIAARGASQEVGTSDENGFFSISNLKPGNYLLQAHPSGFEAYEATQTIAVQEGETIEDIKIPLVPLPPALSVSVNRDVFLPEQELRFNVRSFRIGLYECSIHELPAELLTHPQADVREIANHEDLSPFPVVQRWTNEAAFRNPYVWFDNELKVPEPLPPGVYVLQLASPGLDVQARQIFFVTELGLITKRGDQGLLVYATNLETSLPEAGAKIMLRPRPSNQQNWQQLQTHLPQSQEDVQWAGETNDEGILVLDNVERTSPLMVLGRSADGYFALAQTYRSGSAENNRRRIFVHTDRPIYRPGQTVYYKSVLRVLAQEGYERPVGETAKVEIRNPRGEIMHETSQTISEWGAIDGEFTFPNAAPLGTYRLQVSYDGGQGNISFDLDEYRKPEFRVGITPGKSFYTNGELLRFQVQSEYYFGAPVPNAEVNYRFYETVAAGGSTSRFPSSYTTFLTSGSTQTDAEGIASIDYMPKRSSMDRRITLEVEVEESSGRQVSARQSVPVGVGLFHIQAEPARNVFNEQRPVVLAIETRTHDGQPVSTEVRVEFETEEWNPVRRAYVRPSRPHATRVVQTDEEGKARLEWVPGPDLNGRIIAGLTAEDERGNQITASTSLWRMGSPSGRFAYRYPTLEGILDKEEYQPGEEATLLIHTKYPENPILLTIEGREVISHRVIWPAANSTRVTIPIREDYAPNFHIGLVMPRGVNYSERVYNVSVPVEKGLMQIALEPDRETYKPGQAGKVDIQTTLPDGSPVAAEVSLAVVDEAIFALRSDRTPDIHRIFYGEQPNGVVTTYSYPMRYLGGANKGLQTDIRQDFRDTALWQPAIHTDENGEASITIPYPDNLTTWRLTARAHTKATQVGMVREQTQVTKELVARLNLPRFLQETDRLSIPTLVNNLTDDNLPEIETELQVRGGATLLEASQQTTQAAAGAVARDLWALEVTGASQEAQFTFTARGREDSDGLRLRTPVQYFGFAQSLTAMVDSLQQPEQPFDLPPGVDLSRSSVEVHVAPSLAAVAMGAIGFLEAFPHACVEQTLNRVLPKVLLHEALRGLGGSMPQPLDDYAPPVQQVINQLASLQNGDGGWPWSRNGQSQPHISAMVTHGLQQMEQAGFSVNRYTLRRAYQYLTNRADEVRVWDVQAHLLYVISQNMQRLEPNEQEEIRLYAGELYANRNELSPYGQALAVMALDALGESDQAHEVLASLLAQRVNVANNQQAWEVSQERFWQWNGTAPESTAWGLMAMLQMGASLDEVRPVVNWLIQQRQGNRWRSTRETALVVMALSRLLEREQGEQNAPASMTLSLNGEPLLDETIQPNEWALTQTLQVPAAQLQPAGNQLSLQTGLPNAYASLKARLFRPGPIEQPIGHDYFSLNRRYERAIHTQDYCGRPRILAERYTPEDPLAVGKELLVTLTLQTEQPLPYMVIEEPLPSGFEVIESFLQNNGRGWSPYQNVERRDNRLVFYLDEVPEGEIEVHYLIRAELPGEFHTNPTHAWCMYYPEVESWSRTGTLTVKN